MGWIGVDLDGTLAEYHGWAGADEIGPPVTAMHNRVLAWIREGKTVKCFTARAFLAEQIPAVRAWLDAHGMQALEITCVKDFGMIELWDDRCVRVATNRGVACCASAGTMFQGDACETCGACGEEP